MSTPPVPVAPQVITLLGYEVRVAPWLLDEAGRIATQVARARTWAVITDDHVGPIAAPQLIGSLRHFAPHSRVILRAIHAGEQEKTRESWTQLTDWLLEERCGRDTAIIALGGGVVGDLAGFVAATFMRGVPFVQVPTSLLAMVDASVGGKVGVDTRHGKNLVGAFHQPAAVLVDPTVLQTLPVEHLRAGFAEIVKHGVIADPEYFDAAHRTGVEILGTDPAHVAWHGQALADLVARSVRIKADVVTRDAHEHGLRQVLNFGHTIGHAVELLSDFTMLHGEAISIGMCLEAQLAVHLGLAQPALAERLAGTLRALGLPTILPSGMAPSALLDAMRLDKKARSGTLVFALPSRIGAMADAERGVGVEDAAVERILAEVAS
ncbi:MAG: 3-dehydroquinate synthase [Gemmatimonadaceae bacterium]|nr:3-dehydroquinate synthase [Gemmatimonadaceae bacterium]